MRGNAIVLATMVALLAGCGRTGGSRLPISAELLEHVGPGTIAVAGGQIQPLVSAGLVPPLKGFVGATGFDPSKDVREFVVTYDGKSAVLLAQGAFREAELRKKLEDAKALGEPHGGKTIWRQGEIGFVLLRPDVAAAGPVTVLKSLVDAKSGGMSEGLKKVLEQVPGDAHIWGASMGGIQLPVPPRSNLANVDKLLTMVSSVIASANVSSGVRFQAKATGTDAEGAKKVHDALRGALGFARLSTSTNRQDLLKAYDAIDIRQKETHVLVTAYLPQESVDALLGMARGAGSPRR